MNVSSYLEGFLTVYGWMLYETLYQLFSMLWLVFLPFLMLAYNFFKDTATDDYYGSYGYFKSSVFQFVFMLMVLMFCVVPIDKISIQGAKLNTVCADSKSINDLYSQAADSNFNFSSTDVGKIPILPSIVMRLAQGTNNVIYKSVPCVSSVTDLAHAFKTSRIENDGLKHEMTSFNNQCYKKGASRLTMLRRHFGDEKVDRMAEFFAKEYVRRLGKDWSLWSTNKVNRAEEIRIQKGYMGSDFMLYLMNISKEQNSYSKLTSVLNNTELSKLQSMAQSWPIAYSETPVEGLASTRDDRSQNQIANDEGGVSCSAWWAQLLPKLQNDGFGSLVNNVAQLEAMQDHCLLQNKRDTWLDYLRKLNFYSASQCATAIKNEFKITDEKEYERLMAKLIVESQYTTLGNLALDNGEKTVLATAGTAGVIGSVVGFFPGMGNNVLSTITESAASFYGEMFMYKIIMKFLQPMLLMGIFAFWLFYLIVSSYRGDSVFRGLVLIFAISLLPSIWAIADHIDSHLYRALFPYDDIHTLTERSGSTIERMVLDGASTVFYVIFPLILLYMISEAGGPSGDKGIQSSDRNSRAIGGRFGGAGGRTTGNTAGNSQKRTSEKS